MVAIPRPMGSLKTFRGGHPWRSQETTPDCREDQELELAVGQSMRAGVFHCHYWPRVAALPDWDGHLATSSRPHRCHQWLRHACSVGFANDPPQCCPTAGSSPHPPPPNTTSRVLLLQTTDIPAETARLVRCHNPWPSEDIYFSPSAFQWLRGVDSHPKSPPRASPPALGSECRHLGGGCRRRRSITARQAQVWVPAAHTRALITHPTAAAKQPLQGFQRYFQPRRGRSRLHSAA